MTDDLHRAHWMMTTIQKTKARRNVLPPATHDVPSAELKKREGMSARSFALAYERRKRKKIQVQKEPRGLREEPVVPFDFQVVVLFKVVRDL